ncbi:SDR family NAD(P)-dependent oxidoreductase [Alkalihalophilus pseudofirmus]|uniref:SDR family NAD(P)-dependent oxidoreductase n=1 Tax=Alkalihalophilus pseudofirmus TaxID=79885 RepID=UPI00259B51D8|nr:SDR family NAD(P)-dependent oxidoreductase [Alkalihalophilus pseudofirmus]WEG18968.1 SDR family NAD(P)-dependent oxidoreductase [Alkalihalophilus pseudofirmus]
MKKVLVAGASGGIGSAIVYELRERNINVIALARDEDKLNHLFGKDTGVKVVSGDVLNQEDLISASKGVDIIFHAVSFPYPKWGKTHIPCINHMVKAAEKNRAKIALVDNIYAYGKQPENLVTEEAVKQPHTTKGKIRFTMETILKESNVDTLIVHMPDLYGPRANNTLLHETLKNVAKMRKANYIGDLNKGREFLYTKDGAKALVELAIRKDTYNQSWNIPAMHPISGNELMEIFKENKNYQKPLKSVSKRMIAFLGIFSPFMGELVEMMYLTEQPVILSGEKYESTIGLLPRTSYKQGLNETIRWIEESI